MFAKLKAWVKAKKDYVVAYVWELYAQAKASWAMRGALAAAAIGVFDQATAFLPESMRDSKLFVMIGFVVFAVRWYALHKAAASVATEVCASCAPAAPVADPNAAGWSIDKPTPETPAA